MGGTAELFVPAFLQGFFCVDNISVFYKLIVEIIRIYILSTEYDLKGDIL